ncbi:hypothetical protein OXX69_003242 [Metschnikowia pulcherrima]
MMFLLNVTGTMSQVVRLLAAGTDLEHVFYESAATHSANLSICNIDPNPSISPSSFMNTTNTEYVYTNDTFEEPSIWHNSTIENAPVVNNSTMLESGEAKLNKTRPESDLEKFYSHLRSFVFESSFDVSGFEEDYSYLQTEFLRISKHLAGRKIHTKIHTRFRFCTLLFTQMRNLARLNKLLTLSNFAGGYSLYKVTEIHVRALAMCNSQGEPDMSIVDLADKVMDLKTGIPFWVQQYNNLKNSPIKPARLFRNRVLAAENTLAHLSDDVYFSPVGS